MKISLKIYKPLDGAYIYMSFWICNLLITTLLLMLIKLWKLIKTLWLLPELDEC